ncbi:MAG: DegT/DnrJ/EryC1/StrS family aminotransferase [Coriobacteriia bacterium]|nr:DegT/DnrJ/EryC1/StrS family aminotransferase [Coriobacteriia bacterium]
MIPVNEPLIGQSEMAYAKAALDEGWISSAGRYIDEFEQGFASYCGRRHGIAVANGTVALQLAVSCLNLEPGDEIIMPSFTIISCALAAIYNDAVPCLVDVEPDTWCMDVSQIEAKIGVRTRAIMPVHMYGHPVDMDAIEALAWKHGLAVVEDAAEAHGAEFDGRKCGGFGELSCFSFYANKIVTTGEGGMVLTDDDELAERARSKRNLCFQEQRRFVHEELGFNFRLTNLQAAIGVGQLERIESVVDRRREMAAAYSAGLSGLPLQLPVERPRAKNVYWMYGVVLDDDVDFDAQEFASRLARLGVQTRPFFVGMHEQPVFHAKGLFLGESYPVTERISARGLYLPSGQAITDEQIEMVIAAVHQALEA